MACGRTDCPSCGHPLIHQINRGNGESSSAYGQHIHDTYPQDFFWADVDGVIYKLATGIMRIVEHKPVGGSLRKSQTNILPMLAAALDVLVVEEVLNQDSGVFLVESDPPFDSARVRRYRREEDGKWVPGYARDAVELTGNDLRNFETGMPVDRDGLTGRAA
ncbi:MAG TPA: hypothetical protein VF174_15690 [Micromonosporaceae bacterium]